MTSLQVIVDFVLYEYDPIAKRYYKSCYSAGKLVAVLEKNGSELNLSVADDPSRDVQSPQNYTMQIGIKPAKRGQTIVLAPTYGKEIRKTWSS